MNDPSPKCRIVSLGENRSHALVPKGHVYVQLQNQPMLVLQDLILVEKERIDGEVQIGREKIT